MVDLTKVSTEDLEKFQLIGKTFCCDILCSNCPLHVGCTVTERSEKRQLIKNELDRRKEMNLKVNTEWERLTNNKLNNMGWNTSFKNLKDFLKDYEIEYLILPEGEWKKLTKADGRLLNALQQQEPKIVYRMRKEDKLSVSWNRFLCTRGHEPMTLGEVFTAGFHAGTDSIEEL